jgi:hypothetical protein
MHEVALGWNKVAIFIHLAVLQGQFADLVGHHVLDMRRLHKSSQLVHFNQLAHIPDNLLRLWSRKNDIQNIQALLIGLQVHNNIVGRKPSSREGRDALAI